MTLMLDAVWALFGLGVIATGDGTLLCLRVPK